MKIGITSLSNYVVASKDLLKLKINYIHDPRIANKFGEIDIENFTKSLKFLQKADDTSVSYPFTPKFLCPYNQLKSTIRTISYPNLNL